MTCSFHKYGDGFFPGTGDVSEVGKGARRLHRLDSFHEQCFASHFSLLSGALGASCGVILMLKSELCLVVQTLGVTGPASGRENPMTMQRLLETPP